MRAVQERHGRAKLTLWDVVAIRSLLDEEGAPSSISAIAKAFGISRRHVRRLRDNVYWRME